MATIKQVSELAKVSVATVSRVVNGNAWVAEATQQRVKDAMAQLGYQPNITARALATNRTHTIGMIVGDLSGPFFGDLMYQVEKTVRDHGKHLILTSSHGDYDGEQDAINFLLQRQVDALILQLDSMSDADIVALKERISTPIILVNRYVPELSGQCIFTNNEAGGREATEFLIQQGHENIACITGPLFKQDSRERLQGYRQALEISGLDYRQDLIVESDFTEAGGSLAMERLINRSSNFSAVFCSNDLMALGAIYHAKSKGLNVPEQLSVIGFDNIVMSSYVDPSLTTMHVPIGQMGREAGLLACAMADQKKINAQFQYVPKLTLRKSVKSLDKINQ